MLRRGSENETREEDGSQLPDLAGNAKETLQKCSRMN